MTNMRMQDGRVTDEQLALEAAHSLAERTFRRADIPSVRHFAFEFGSRAGLRAARLSDFVLAVSEAAACATVGGPCTAWVRLWATDTHAFCEVRGDGMLLLRSARGSSARGFRPGGRQGEEEAMRRWVLRQVCDHVCVIAGPDEVRVLLSMAIA
jgi:hypothetical protein